MEFIKILSPLVPGLQKAIHKSIIKNKPLKQCFKTRIDFRVKCFKCGSTDYANLKMIQVKSSSRCSDELIESHYFCKMCRKKLK